MEEPIRLVIALAPACGPCTSKLVSSKTPRLHFSVGTADSWLPRSIIGVYQIFAHVCAKVVICLEGLEFFFEGGTHTNAGETMAGWNAIARSLFGVCFVVFGLVITVGAFVAYAGASQHTNRTAKLSGIIESLRFLSSIGNVSTWFAGH